MIMGIIFMMLTCRQLLTLDVHVRAHDNTYAGADGNELSLLVIMLMNMAALVFDCHEK